MTSGLISPISGAPLVADTPHSLACPGERWPVVDAIPYLRTGRGELVAETLAALDRGDPESALAVLLADQDDWWDGPPAPEADLRAVIRERWALSLRDAMDLLGFGRVGDYFAHRWSDPTYLAGLALIEAHWTGPATAFELACGIGHYLGELTDRGVAVTGADVVFSKLWLARGWVVGPDATFVCFDASGRWPIPHLRADLVLCQDAFYFLEPKAHVLSELRRVAEPLGVLDIGHVHNREADNLSAGAGVTAAEMEAFFPDGLLYDDAELTGAAAEGIRPGPRPGSELRRVEAFAVAAGPGRPAGPATLSGLLTLPRVPEAVRPNPLYAAAGKGEERVAWPSERYRREYEGAATYPVMRRTGAGITTAGLRRREFVALPERW